MHMRGVEYRLEPDQRRIAVVGTSGAGKTTLCEAMAQAKDIPYTEIDSLFHGPHWEPRAEFLDDVQAILNRDEWIIEWQYRLARPLITPRAQVFVWLDLPIGRRMARLTRRTVGRWRSGGELWNGNREPGPSVWLKRCDDNILWWGWKTRHKLDDLEDQLASQYASGEAVVVRLTGARQVREWRRLNGL